LVLELNKVSGRAGRPQLGHFTYLSSFVFLDKREHDCKAGDGPQLCYRVDIPYILITYIYTATGCGRLYLHSVKEKMQRG